MSDQGTGVLRFLGKRKGVSSVRQSPLPRGGFRCDPKEPEITPIDPEIQMNLDREYVRFARLSSLRIYPGIPPRATDSAGGMDSAVGLAPLMELSMTELPINAAVQSLAIRLATTAKDHPGTDIQTAFGLEPESLPRDVYKEMETHLRTCERCQSTQERLQKDLEHYRRIWKS